jgi:hypothetical protein
MVSARLSAIAFTFILIEVASAALASSFLALPTPGVDHVLWMLAPALATIGAFALASSSSVRHTSLAWIAGTAGAAGVGASLGALGARVAALEGLGPAFAAPLLVGCAVWKATEAVGPGRRTAAAVLFGAGATTVACGFVAERIDFPSSPWAIGVGGILALGQLVCSLVAVPRGLGAAADAVDFLTEAPRGLALVVAGRGDGEDRP